MKNSRIPNDHQCKIWWSFCYMFVGIWISILMVIAAPFVLCWAVSAPIRWLYWNKIDPFVYKVCRFCVETPQKIAKDKSWIHALYCDDYGPYPSDEPIIHDTYEDDEEHTEC